MRLNGKITRIRRRNFTSLIFQIVHNFRDYAGRPRNRIIAAFKTVRSDQLLDIKVRQEFWQAVDAELIKIKLMQDCRPQDLDAIRRRFHSVLPRPSVRPLPPPAKTTPSPVKTTLNDLMSRYGILAETKNT